MTHFNKLTPAEAERLALLLEELGETQQVIGKILRHGYESSHPNGGLKNRLLLEAELGDVLVAVELLWEAEDVDRDTCLGEKADKLSRVSQYLHHATVGESTSSERNMNESPRHRNRQREGA